MSESFRKLTDYEHARIRVEMYLGSKEMHTASVFGFDGKTYGIHEFTWVPSIYVAIRELLDNSIDEVCSHGYGDTIWVTYDPDTMKFGVRDNGRGMPIDGRPELGKGPAASILMGEARAGRNFDERGTVAGLNGIGASIVNFTSEYFELVVNRDGKKLTQVWTEGTYRKKDIHKTDGPVITKAKGNGTSVTFIPSRKVWSERALPLDFLRHRLWDIALANPKTNIHFNGEKLSTSGRDPVREMVFGRSVGLVKTKSEKVDASFYIKPYDTDDVVIHSIVNNIPVFEGGSHITEIKSLLFSALIEIIEPMVKKAMGVKKRDVKFVNKSDVSAGLIIYNITKMIDPHFNGQTKERLSSEIRTDIRAGFLKSDVATFVAKNKEWVDSVIERCQQRQQKSQNRELSKQQKKLEKTKVASLRDATGKHRQKCTLYITEGQSATAGLLSARDSKIHGALPLRGKIMNVNGVSPKKILASEALRDIMASIGLKIGERANPMHLRYGRIHLCTDADQDGKNISALLVNFLYTFWPELFDGDAIVYDFDTPLVILKKGKKREYIYSDGYDDFKPEKYKGWTIIRAKGLARLEQDDWAHVLDHPKVTPITDNGNLKETLSLIFDGTRADDRKDWLS